MLNAVVQPSGQRDRRDQPRAAAIHGVATWSAFDVRSLASKLDFVAADAVLPELCAADKETVIRTLVHCLADAGAVADAERDEVLSAVLRRESISPTAIGHGIAIPHARHPGVQRVVAGIAYCPEGIVFGGRYGSDVHLIILLVSPENSPTAYLQALSELSQRLLATTQTDRYEAAIAK